MENILNQTILLKELLGRFVNILYLDDMELERMNDFIFSTQTDSDLIQEDTSELYDTLEFLRDLARDGSFTDVEQLLNYFNDQDASLDSMIQSELQLIYHQHAGNNDISYRMFPIRSGVKRIGHPVAGPVKSHEDILEDLFRCLTSDPAADQLENHYAEINQIKKGRSKNVFRVCSLHTQILPNTDHIHFDHYYRSFAPSKKGFLRFISIIKRMKAWFSGLSLRRPFQVPSDILRKHKERIKVRKLYADIYDSIRKEEPIENEQLKLALSRIMLIAKFNNPLFKSQQLTNCNECKFDFRSRRRFYQFFSQKNWVVLKSPDGLSWNTTDNPGFSIDMNDVLTGCRPVSPDPYWKEISENSLIYFPLSDQYCLRLAPDDFQTAMSHESKINFEYSSEQELEVVNKLSLVSKPEVLISPLHGIRKRTEGMICEIG